MSRIIFVCLPRTSKFQEYVQRRKRRNLFCFLKSDVISCYSGVNLLKKVGKGNLYDVLTQKQGLVPVFRGNRHEAFCGNFC